MNFCVLGTRQGKNPGKLLLQEEVLDNGTFFSDGVDDKNS